MSKVSEYRQHPKECRVLAHRSRSSQHRDMLLDMAATWESLPDEPAHSAAAGRHLVDALQPSGRKLHHSIPRRSRVTPHQPGPGPPRVPWAIVRPRVQYPQECMSVRNGIRSQS